jgi:REP element-mobilizing transposase RayT
MATAQLSLKLKQPPARPKRGGARPGAGRPRKHPLPAGWDPKRRFVPHLRRATIDRHRPAHVTLRLHRVARTLRNGKMHAAVHRAFLAGCQRDGFRLVHYSVQGDHLHLIVEADSRARLASGMRGLGVRLARSINRQLDRRGAVVADRYHAHILATPTEVRNALLYVLNNARKHAAQQRGHYDRGWVDPFSSAAEFDGWAQAVSPDKLALPRCTAQPRCWLLTTGWRRRGRLDPDAIPGAVHR